MSDSEIAEDILESYRYQSTMIYGGRLWCPLEDRIIEELDRRLTEQANNKDNQDR